MIKSIQDRFVQKTMANIAIKEALMFHVKLKLGDADKDGRLDLTVDVDLLKGLFKKKLNKELDKDTVLDQLARNVPALSGAVDGAKDLLNSNLEISLGDANRNGKIDLDVNVSLLNGAFKQKATHDFDAVSMFSLILKLGPSLMGLFAKK